MIGEVEVETLKDTRKCRVVIDGTEMENCNGLSFHYWDGFDMPEITIETIGIPSFKGQANVKFDYVPETFHETLDMMWDYLFFEKHEEYQKLFQTAKEILNDEDKAKSLLDTMEEVVRRLI